MMSSFYLEGKKKKMMNWWGMTFQNSISGTAYQLDWFHDYICLFLIWILISVGFFLIYLSTNNWLFKGSSELPTLEFLWTILPAMILIFIGVPSMYILYMQSVDNSADLTLKITGSQWFWTYNYQDFLNVSFDSFMLPINKLPVGGFRLLDTDNHVVLPIQTTIRVGVCASDVLHAWSLPSLGLKVDAVPGRMNFLNMSSSQMGLFYGQCSEICGSNHSFMPISLEVTSFSLFKTWLKVFI